MKTFVLGDIHGNDLALAQCLERSKFNKKEDTLIFLGDVVDGYSHVKECVDILLDIPNLISIRGNHDDWFMHFMIKGIHPVHWFHGGGGTVKSYMNASGMKAADYMRAHFNNTMIPREHQRFFERQISYYVDDQNRCFVHGGFNRHEPIASQSEQVLMWDRDLWSSAMNSDTIVPLNDGYKFKTKDNFKEVFIGHTATLNWSVDDEMTKDGIIVEEGKQRTTTPMHAANIWNVDTGCGWPYGRLTIMNVDTHEYFQSDFSGELYPGEQSR